MLEDYIFQNLLLALPLWLMLYSADYAFTLLGARYYAAGAGEHFAFEGSYELTPQFQQDVDALRLFPPSFIKAILISSTLIVALWCVSRIETEFLLVFKLVIGGMMVQEFAVLIRHARNLVLFRAAMAHQGMSGQIRYEQWLSYRLSAAEFFCFAGLFLIVGLFTGSISFLGGAVMTDITALKHRRLSRKVRREAD